MKPSPYVVEQVFKEVPVLFRQDGWVNATQLAAGYDARVQNFMRLDGTVRYIDTLRAYLTRKVNSLTSELIKTVEVMETTRGRYGSGTWMHPLLAIEFARWLDPELAIWCNEVVLEVMGGRPVTPEVGRKLWARHTALELLGWCQEIMVEAAPGVRVKEIRGTATEIREALLAKGRPAPSVNWLGRWLNDLKATHGQSVAEFSRGHARREWVIRARPG